MESLKEFANKLREKYEILKESIEFGSDFNDLLSRIPNAEDIDNYYYDSVKNLWIRKSTMPDYQTVEIASKSVILKEKSFVGICSKETDFSQVCELDFLASQITIEIFNVVGTPDVFKIYYYLQDNTKIELDTREYLYNLEAGVYTFYCQPFSRFFIDGYCYTGYNRSFEYKITFSQNLNEVISQSFDQQNKGLKWNGTIDASGTLDKSTWQEYNQNLYNRISIKLWDYANTNNLNLTLTVYTWQYVGGGTTRRYHQLYTETITPSDVSYETMIELDNAHDNIRISLVNNIAYSVDYRISLFFSKSKTPETLSLRRETIFFYGSGGFAVSIYRWQIAHSDSSAYIAFSFIVPKTASYKIVINHWSDTASRTDNGSLYAGQHKSGDLISINNKINSASFNLVNSGLNRGYFTKSTTITLTKDYTVMGYWYKNNNAGTGNLNIPSIWLEEQV